MQTERVEVHVHAFVIVERSPAGHVPARTKGLEDRSASPARHTRGRIQTREPLEPGSSPWSS